MKNYSKNLILMLSLVIIILCGSTINCSAVDTTPQPEVAFQENTNNNTKQTKNTSQQQNTTKRKKNKKKTNSENAANPAVQDQTPLQNENNLQNAASDTTNVTNTDSTWSNSENQNKKKYSTSSKKTKSKKNESLGATEPKPFAFSIEDVNTLDSSSSLTQETSQSQSSISQESEYHSVPSDLPSVESSDIVLPQVTASSPNNSNNLVPGIIAWSFIAIGVFIVIFILFKGSRQNNDISLNNKSCKNKKGKSRLLSDKYYK